MTLFLEWHPTPPKRIVLDLDATGDPVHGAQEGRFFHGYDRNYCDLTLYIFCGDASLRAKLRPSKIDGAACALEELQTIVVQIRSARRGPPRAKGRSGWIDRGIAFIAFSRLRI